MKDFKISQKKDTLSKMVISSIFALFMVVAIYVQQNINLVLHMVEYKKALNKIAKLEKENTDISNQVSSLRRDLPTNLNSDLGLKNKEPSVFIVRKNLEGSLTILHSIR